MQPQPLSPNPYKLNLFNQKSILKIFDNRIIDEIQTQGKSVSNKTTNPGTTFLTSFYPKFIPKNGSG